MKIKKLLAMVLCAAIGIAMNQTAFAQEHKEHKEGGETVKIPDTVDGILKEIHTHHQELADTVKAKKLADVHHHAFAIRDLAKALPPKANPDHKKMVENSVKKVSQLAEDLDKSGDAGDQAKTEANLKKMDAELKTLEEHAKM
jgi:hypothetical protein